MMDYLNRCLLLGRFRAITIIDDNVSCLVIIINVEDGDLTIPIITSTDVANKITNNCEEDSLMTLLTLALPHECLSPAEHTVSNCSIEVQ